MSAPDLRACGAASARSAGGGAGFTLIEIGFVLGIVATLVALTATSYRSYIENVRVKRAVFEIAGIADSLEATLAENDALPPTLAGVGVGGMLDPWGNPYEYLPLAPTTPAPGSWAAGPGAGGAGGGGGGAGAGGGVAGARKDRFLVPINSDFDLYSRGADGESVPALTAAKSRDDVVRAANGAYIGLASHF